MPSTARCRRARTGLLGPGPHRAVRLRAAPNPFAPAHQHRQVTRGASRTVTTADPSPGHEPRRPHSRSPSRPSAPPPPARRRSPRHRARRSQPRRITPHHYRDPPGPPGSRTVKQSRDSWKPHLNGGPSPSPPRFDALGRYSRLPVTRGPSHLETDQWPVSRARPQPGDLGLYDEAAIRRLNRGP